MRPGDRAFADWAPPRYSPKLSRPGELVLAALGALESKGAKMRVLAINQFYPPDHAASGQLLAELCEDLAASGDEVTVIASRGRYLGGTRLVPRETRAGVSVVRPWATSFGKASRLHRMTDYVSFWATSIAEAARATRPDVIVALTTPPMIALGAASVALTRAVPLVTWVQDVYPDVAAAFGVLAPNSVAYSALSRAAAATHQATTRIVALSDGMAERLMAQAAPPERIRVVHNWSDGTTIRPMPRRENPFRRQHDLSERFVVMYSGNLGVGHEIATFVGAASQLRRTRPEVVFLFVGDGARLAEARSLARGLENVRFMPYQPKEQLSASLTAADVHLISLRNGLEGLLVPSKLYGALASGRPICYVGPERCEVSHLVRENALGWAGPCGDGPGLAAAITELLANDRLWQGTGMRARTLFEKRFDRPIATRAWRDVLADALRSPGQSWTAAGRIFRAAIASNPPMIPQVTDA